MRGHGRGRKTEWFFRLLFGTRGKASRTRSPVVDGQAHGSHVGSFTRFLTAVKRWLLITLPAVQISGSAPAAKARPPSQSDTSAADFQRRLEQAQLENLEADTRFKNLQAEVLEDERDLKRRKYVLDIELAEIKRALTLLGVVIVGALAVASIVLCLVAPELTQPGPNLLELLPLLGK
jgi:hypothetical protein